MNLTRLNNRLFFLGAVALTGALAGAAVWCVFFAMNTGIAFVWEYLPQRFGPFFPLAACAVGGVVIGLFERRWGVLVKPLQAVMQEVKETGGYRCEHIGRLSVAAVLPLVFGGSVGPEAGLTGIIAALCTWVGDRMRRFGADFQELTRLGMTAALTALFSAPLFGFAAPLCGDPARDERIELPRRAKAVAYLVAIVGALLAIAVLRTVFGHGAGLPHFSAAQVGAPELLAGVAAVVLGGLGGWLYHGLEHAAEGVHRLFGSHTVLRCVCVGLALGACGMALPWTMFSGEEFLPVLAQDALPYGAGVLLLIASVKLALTVLCVECGWRGGHFFPAIFCGASLGCAVALLTGADVVFCMALSCGALMGAMMRNAVMAALLLLLCFPVTVLPYLAVAALVAAAVPLPHAWRPLDEGADAASCVDPSEGSHVE